MQTLDTLDWVFIGVYFLILAGIAVWIIRNKKENTEDYFLAGRNVGWFVVGASIFASNIGSEHVVGLAGAGAGNKLPMLIYELHAWVVLLLGWVFLPFYARSGVFTMPEFLEKRFDARSRWVLSIFSIVAYVLTKISVTIYAGGVVVSALLGIDFWTGALSTVVLTGLYTIIGGMKAVVYTETLQAIVLVLGAATLTIVGLDAVGGWQSMQETVGPEYLDMWRSASDPEFPWPSLLISSSIVGIWYWCTDQYIVQRTLTARNIKEGRRGTIFGALLKLLPVFLFLIPGIIALTLKMRGELEWDSPDEAFPVLMSNLLPSGIRGLVAAGLLAALMSSLASVFNSCSTLFTVDIYKKLRPNTPEKKLVRTGQIATLVVVVIGIIWIPIMANISGVLYEYLQSVQSYIAPPITAVFLLGIFYRRINATASFVTLITGLIVGSLRIVLEIIKGSLDQDGLLFYLGDMNFLEFGAWFFLFCVILLLVVSLLTPEPSKEKTLNLTFSTITEEEKRNNKSSYNWKDIVITIVVIIIVAGIMIFFNGN
ncbi:MULTISPECIES: sodium:solute symporter [Christiangramia]|uniref:Putative sodium-dependent galactose transporter n=1 Tax=Christiangramia flava JLT2011 TaxID=1229726 RepID=A0A1L7I1Q7_9FLAO|nr:sodium:solute symporter [Christiangramia flava]APU67065.1 putative sodium-dependent galactose transporter [Christiangramia flava JLT2011]OSS38738.1 Na+/glucose cotransporter [Christiangramia flava JLT2011]